MAHIVLGMASSHAPQLAMHPNQWRAYGDRSRTQSEHWFQGKTYTFEELVDLRAEGHFEQECTEEKFQARFDACQEAITHLANTLATLKPDVAIIFGDDQHEVFKDDNHPALAVFHAETVDDAPRDPARWMPRDPVLDNMPRERLTHPVEKELADLLIERLTADEFDITRANAIRPDYNNGAIGHAFHYVYRRLMDNKAIPHVPVMVNTYYPPNVPPALRTYRLGQSVRRAVEAWDSDKRVAIIASGGLSHTVIEEELDHRIIEGLLNDDVRKLTHYPDVRFRAGTSEVKNWIALAGAMSGNGLKVNLVDYVPCYRTEAGNGCAMGFAEWV